MGAQTGAALLQVVLDTLGFLAKFGTGLSAIALFIGAAAAWMSYIRYHKRSLYMTWIDGYRTLYGEFWKDDKIAEVRNWITSDEEYTKIEIILEERLKSDRNLLGTKANEVLEKLDRFCALLARIEFFYRTPMNKWQRDLWHITYGDFWIRKIREREKLRQYIEKYWSGLELGVFLHHRNLYHAERQERWSPKKRFRFFWIGISILIALALWFFVHTQMTAAQ